jgi:hypothetical protein
MNAKPVEALPVPGENGTVYETFSHSMGVVERKPGDFTLGLPDQASRLLGPPLLRMPKPAKTLPMDRGCLEWRSWISRFQSMYLEAACD